MQVYNEEFRSNELYHYGVRGMRWGKRRSPRIQPTIQNRRHLNSDYYSIINEQNGGGGGGGLVPIEGNMEYNPDEQNIEELQRQQQMLENASNYNKMQKIHKTMGMKPTKLGKIKVHKIMSESHKVSMDKIKSANVNLGKSKVSRLVNKKK